ncbi:type IV pilus modification PilV family protein [Acetobacterium woodii]|uniref:Prepilin-type N-terminal cleavage/methylation domain-containing protein n=1 Tax=Acetobacterium woodii (strain ATCC 29683 / DSM 1030 / JCM 2381 / KCTC 1655 / WB1) TaxID=931626 RepID=H6LEU6_ACEWD|nr:type II secretion system protein [Acetobacterium woodii]AFA49389.1 hypothetical protein Awo_c26330 [Acetobacterium woodii DSM 1030]
MRLCLNKTDKPVLQSQQGYTLVEAIIAIAVCGFGLAMILGLYGMSIKTAMVSKTIFEQSVVINSIADEINLSVMTESPVNLVQRVAAILANKYPDYYLSEIKAAHPNNLYEIEIIHKGINCNERKFYIKVFWSQNE